MTLALLAEVFSRPVEEIRRLLSQLPMDSAAVAVEMNVTNSQVNQWRFYAIKRMEKVMLPLAALK